MRRSRYELRGSSSGLRRRIWLALAAVLVAVFFPTGAAGDASPCTHGVSSVGPVMLVHGHISGDLTPDAETCLS